MMKYIISLLIIISMFSCSLEKRCARIQKKCPAEVVIVTKDSIVYRELIEIHDSIIEVKLPNDTVWITKTLYINADGLINIDTIIVNTGIIEALAWINDSELGVVAYVKDSALFYALDSARIEITRWKEQYTDIMETRTVKVRENSDFAGFAIWWFWITLSVIATFIVVKFTNLKKLF